MAFSEFWLDVPRRRVGVFQFKHTGERLIHFFLTLRKGGAYELTRAPLARGVSEFLINAECGSVESVSVSFTALNSVYVLKGGKEIVHTALNVVLRWKSQLYYLVDL